MDSFIGNIRIFAFPWAPRGYSLCMGQQLPISQYQALYTFLGTTFGGNGVTTFALPDLRGRTPRGTGGGVALGQRGGESTHVLTPAELPQHTHTVPAGGRATDTSPVGLAPAEGPDEAYALFRPPVVEMEGRTGSAGQAEPHENMQPFTTLSFAIAQQGVLPPFGGSGDIAPGGEPILGEVRMFAGIYEPNGWFFCDGRELPISEHQELFYLIGTTFGGDGVNTFRIPDMRGRIPLHFDASAPLGTMGGAEQVTLTPAQLPIHDHALIASAAWATSTSPAGMLPARTRGATYAPRSGEPELRTASDAGRGQPHDNMAPSLAIQFMICVAGIFPTPP